MQAQPTTFSQSAYDVIRSTPIEVCNALWSQGKTIRQYEDPKPRFAPVDHSQALCRLNDDRLALLCAPCQRELDELVKTSETFNPRDTSDVVDQNLPPISNELRDWGYDLTDSEYIQDTVPDTEAAPEPEWTEATTVMSAICELMGLDVDPYKDLPEPEPMREMVERPTPLTMRRIAWERSVRLATPTVRLRLKVRDDGSLGTQISGVKLTQEQYIAAHKKYVERLKALPKGIPTAERIQRFHEKIAGHSLAELVPYAEQTFTLDNYLEGDADPTRDAFHTADTPLLESLDTAMAAIGLDSLIVWDDNFDPPRMVDIARFDWDLGKELPCDLGCACDDCTSPAQG